MIGKKRGRQSFRQLSLDVSNGSAEKILAQAEKRVE